MLLRIFPSAAIRFMAYEQLKSTLIPTPEYNRPWRHFLAGSIAGNIAVLATYPLEVIRTRLAFTIRTSNNVNNAISNSNLSNMNGSSTISHHTTPHGSYGVWNTIKLIYKENGNSMKGFYKGFGPTMLGIVPYAGAAFMTHSYLKDICINKYPEQTTVLIKQSNNTNTNDTNTNSNSGKRVLSVGSHLLVGGVAGMVGQTAAYPLDTIRHRMQLHGIALNIPKYKHTLDAFKTILRKESWRGLFLGLSINYWKTMPANAVAFVVYDRLKLYLGIDS